METPPPSLLLRQALLFPPTAKGRAEGLYDLLIEGGRIARIAPQIELPEDTREVPLGGKRVVPAFVDLHVHLREPGNPEKETLRTGTEAAAAGGYALVCAMPNLEPAPDSLEHLAIEEDIIRRDAQVQVLPYGTITRGRKGKELVDFHAMKPHCAGFSDDGSGVQDASVMRRAMEAAAKEGVLLAAHCEDDRLRAGGYIHAGRYAAAHGHKGICSESEWGPIERDLALCAETGCRYHVCHVSTWEGVERIREAKAKGVRVTAETAPHYLVLTEDDLIEDGRFKMNPPLRTEKDRLALVEGLRDGSIDVVATDHAPHTAAEKARGLAGSAMGIVGLETAFPVLYTRLVRDGGFPLQRLLEAMSLSGRRILGLGGGTLEEGTPADLTILDTETPFKIDSATFRSKGKSTPFDGREVFGKVCMTLVGGRIAYPSPPGSHSPNS